MSIISNTYLQTRPGREERTAPLLSIGRRKGGDTVWSRLDPRETEFVAGTGLGAVGDLLDRGAHYDSCGGAMRLDWGGHPIDVREAGAGPCVVLVHGYPLDGAMWSGVARVLATRFRVLKPDLPGRGENPAPAPHDLEGYADFLESLLKELPPPVGLAGFSMGGYVCLALLRRQPAGVRALALVDTRAEADDEEGKRKRDEAIAAVRAAGVAKIAEAMVPKLLSEASLANRDLVERLRRIILRQKAETVEADLTAMRGRRDASDLLAQIRIPALILVGEQDAITPPALSEKMAAAIPGAQLAKIPASGHLTPMERPSAVAAALGDFFASALAG